MHKGLREYLLSESKECLLMKLQKVEYSSESESSDSDNEDGYLARRSQFFSWNSIHIIFFQYSKLFSSLFTFKENHQYLYSLFTIAMLVARTYKTDCFNFDKNIKIGVPVLLTAGSNRRHVSRTSLTTRTQSTST